VRRTTPVARKPELRRGIGFERTGDATKFGGNREPDDGDNDLIGCRGGAGNDLLE